MRSPNPLTHALVLIVATMIPFSASYAQNQNQTINRDSGPAGTGGGHRIEAGFRKKTEEIFKFANDMSDEGKKHLKFNPSEVLVNLSVRGRFSPKCAVEGSITLQYLRDRKAMAYVGAEGAHKNEISLDCSSDQEKNWNEAFASDDEGSHIFFIHEGLRNNNIHSEDENDYRTSGSYLSARKANGVFVSQEIRSIVYADSYVCMLEILFTKDAMKTSAGGDTAKILFRVQRQVVAYLDLPPREDFLNFDVTYVNSLALTPNSKLGMWIYNRAKQFQCALPSDQNKMGRKLPGGFMIGG